MRNNLSQNQIISDVSTYYKLLLDPRLQVEMVIPITEDVVRVVYRPKKDFVKEHSTSNIIISLWTTSVARLVLYRYMRQVDDTPGCRVLYTDTDSIIYKHPRGKNPLIAGQFLGEMTMEYEDSHIEEFCCGVSLF